jgi:hypothetical protein
VTQVLAAFIAIPYGLSVLMRGSDGLNRGTHSYREATTLAAAGALLILSSLAMLMGVREAGVLTVGALLAGVAVALLRNRRLTGVLAPGSVLSQALLGALLTMLIAAGF